MPGAIFMLWPMVVLIAVTLPSPQIHMPRVVIVPVSGVFGVDTMALGALSVRRLTVEDLVSKQNLLARSAERDRQHSRIRPSLSCVRNVRNR